LIIADYDNSVAPFVKQELSCGGVSQLHMQKDFPGERNPFPFLHTPQVNGAGSRMSQGEALLRKSALPEKATEPTRQTAILDLDAHIA
jgi:hypothetical protein